MTPASGATTLYFVFALSGLTGLIYEATWSRYLQLFLGHAAYAQVLVLSLFMGGMAAGALIVSRLSATRVRPLVAYAIVEAILGVAAFAFHPLFDGVTSYAYDVLLPGAPSAATASILQWALASALIVPQSIMLGMTFPLMSAGVLRLGSGKGGRVFATLYFANSAGAVIGVLLAGFWLFERLGFQATMNAAGCANLVVAAVALWIARRGGESASAVTRPTRSADAGRWLLAVAFLTGVSSFFYEISWLRMLSLVQGASTHAFETMLSAFVAGIALGGLWIRGRIERVESPMAFLAWMQMLMGVAAVATLPAYHLAFDAIHQALISLPRTEWGYAGYNVIGYFISAGIMMPASFFAGTTLPLLTHILYSRGRGESEIGAVYGWNTLGSIAGIALGSLVLMPMIGVKDLVVVGAAVDVALGIALVYVILRPGAILKRQRLVVMATIATGVILVGLVGFELDPGRMASGVFRGGSARIASDSKVLFHADGRTATVAVVSSRDGTLAISTNGKTDAAINMARARGNHKLVATPDEFTMTFLGALPLAYNPDARRAAVIGHGSGLTTQVLLGSPKIEDVSVIEIESEMIRAARAFEPRVSHAYDDPRARFIVDDARAFFARAPQRYDVVVSEPSNPWVSGVASLYTPEFYRRVRHSLAPGGLFVQWLQLYEFDRALVSSVMGSIGDVFSDYVLYAANDSDMVIVATASGHLPPISSAVFEWPGLRSELDYLDIRTPAQLQTFRVASGAAYGPLLEHGRRNTDYFPYLEFGASRARFLGHDDKKLIELARDPVPVLEMLSGFEPPRQAEFSFAEPHYLDRFLDVRRAGAIVDALNKGATGAPGNALDLADARDLARVRDVRAEMPLEQWQPWFAALFNLSKPLIANGGAPALDRWLESDTVARALQTAPEEIRAKVNFLALVGKRDLDRLRTAGTQLLATPIQKSDPGFHAYVLVATSTACLLAPPDPRCDDAFTQLKGVQRVHPVWDLLRAQLAARPQ